MTAATQSEATPRRLPLTALIAALVALAALFLTAHNWIVAPIAGALICSFCTTARLDGGGNFVRLGRYTLFALVLWQAYDYITSPTADSQEMILAYTVGYLCAIEMAIQCWMRRPASGARSPATILLSSMVFLAASNTYDLNYIRFLTPLYFLFLGLSWRAYQPAAPNSRAFWKSGLLLTGALALSSLVHGAVWQNRQEISNWGMRFLEGRAPTSTGISTDPHLGSSYNLRAPLNRMLRVEDATGNGEAGDAAFYLRAVAFSDYADNRWMPVVSQEPGQTTEPDQLKSRVNSARFRPRPLRIVRIQEDQNFVFAPLHVAGFHFPPDSLIQWNGPLGPLQVSASTSQEDVTYDLSISNKERFQGFLCAPPDTAWLARYLKVPDDIDPLVRKLARAIGKGAKNDHERVRAVETYLLANHHYSLTSRLGPGDRVSDFLLHKRNAHCEFFASAGAVLLRCLGIPCRYVVGYLAHEPDGPDSLVVRGRDAHAWIECWIDNQWVTEDFTPGDGRPEGRAGPLPLSLRFSEWVQHIVRVMRAWIVQLRSPPVHYWWAGIAVLVVFLIWRGRGRGARRRKIEEFRYAARDAELSRLATEFERWLWKRGAPCPAGLTWSEHLRRTGLVQAVSFAKRFDAARFGRDDNIAELQNLLTELERQP